MALTQYRTTIYVVTSSILFSALIFGWINFSIPAGTTQTITLTRIYALTSMALLYLTLLAGPFCYTFRSFPWRGQYMLSRRGLGLSVFYFAMLHSLISFFGQLGGFAGIGFLSNRYLLATSIGFVALVIFTIMAATSFDRAMKNFRLWKFIHRFIYLAGALVFIHALLLGPDFSDLRSTISQVTFAAVIFLLYLEATRIDAFLEKNFPSIPKFGLSVILVTVLTVAYIGFLFLPTGSGLASLDIHAQHILLAKQAQQGIIGFTGQAGSNANPALVGDPTKRYTVSFLHADTITPNQDTQLTFQVYDASNGFPVTLFQKVQDKLLHLVIVDSSLTYFAHIHPDLTANGFTITTQFPKADVYHLYLDFQPAGAIEQQIGLSLVVGASAAQSPIPTPDMTRTKTFGAYTVAMSYPTPLKASELAIGNQTITFTITDAQTKKPITTLKPYLAAFGHLVMVNTKTFDYIHVHPSNLTIPAPDANSGPTVQFLPLGLYGPIKPGLYRLFAQFNPDNHLITADFAVSVE